MNIKLLIKAFLFCYGYFLALVVAMFSVNNLLLKTLDIALINQSSFLILLPSFSFTIAGKLLLSTVLIVFILAELYVYRSAQTNKLTHILVSSFSIFVLPVWLYVSGRDKEHQWQVNQREQGKRIAQETELRIQHIAVYQSKYYPLEIGYKDYALRLRDELPAKLELRHSPSGKPDISFMIVNKSSIMSIDKFIERLTQ